MESQGNTPRNICLDAFDISAHEISIGEFKAFLVSTGPPLTHPSLEVLAHELPVGSFPPDSSGLYDMHGNADEWTLSCFHNHDERVERRILGHRLGTCRHISVRGGSYRNTANRLRIWQRASQDSTLGDDDIGFRVVRLTTPPPSPD